MAISIKKFTELLVWQKAHKLMLDVYDFTPLLPKDEKYCRVSQLKRSVASTPANIAEGFGRFHYQENIQFCRQARGSLEETANHIIAARDLEQVPSAVCDSLLGQCDEIRALLNGYIKSLQVSKNKLSNN